VAERTEAGDARGYRVALIADELVNPPAGGVDGLAALERAGWGVVQLPSAAYPAAVAGPLLEQVAEQAEEFARHGYVLAIVGGRDGLTEALAAYGIAGLPSIRPRSAGALDRFLETTGGGRPAAHGS
jgi:hypothetical protein